LAVVRLNYIELLNDSNEVKVLTLKERLASFDRATVRQRKRNLLAAKAGIGSRVKDRGWARKELYARGCSRTQDRK
jgi:hypothetical protein